MGDYITSSSFLIQFIATFRIITRLVVVVLIISAVYSCTTNSKADLKTSAIKHKKLYYKEFLGNDLYSAEVFTTNKEGFSGKLLKRSPVTELANYEGFKNPDGVLSYFKIHWSVPKVNTIDKADRIIEFIKREGYYLYIETRNNKTDTTVFKTSKSVLPHAVKMPIPFVLLHEIYANPQLTENNEVGFLRSRFEEPDFRAWRHIGKDTMGLDFMNLPMLSVWNGEHVTWRSGKLTTVKTKGFLQNSTFDIDSLANYYATLDKEGRGLGIASPPTFLEKELNGTSVRIDYFQPSARGRKVFGYLIPTDTIWRTGANAATKLTINKPLTINKITIPKGMYSIWSFHSQEKSELIINGNAETWGTNYDANKDLFRIPLVRNKTNEFVEKFQIDIDNKDDENYLILRWGNIEFSTINSN